MAKSRIVFVCSNCGAQSAKWIGKCPSCQEWNTYLEEIIGEAKQTAKRQPWAKEEARPVLLKDAVAFDESRTIFPSDPEINRVLGGGMVDGSLILLGGQPGIGKSTLTLQLACQLGANVLYVSGEESLAQIKMRATRVATQNDHCYFLAETDVSKILNHAAGMDPGLIIVDSIQTVRNNELESAPGTVGQIRSCTLELQSFSKRTGVPVVIIGHITKDGAIAGPKILEHIVDVVLQFEGDANFMYRILRTVKNRYGSTQEIGLYEMKREGLLPVINPGELLLSHSEVAVNGSAIAATVEGVRPLLIEVQALVSRALYGNPQRNATGFDTKRLGMILAVLEKKCGLYFSDQDVFLNVAGGLRLVDPAADLSVVTALTSSMRETAIDQETCFAGEVALSGEIKAVSHIDLRIQEAARMGFQTMYISKYNKQLSGLDPGNLKVIRFVTVEELLDHLFNQ